MATIRQRKSGVWEVRVFVGNNDTGRPKQVSRTVRGTAHRQRVQQLRVKDVARAADESVVVSDEGRTGGGDNVRGANPGSKPQREARSRWTAARWRPGVRLVLMLLVLLPMLSTGLLAGSRRVGRSATRPGSSRMTPPGSRRSPRQGRD